MKKYFFANPEYMQNVYGAAHPLCLDAAAVHQRADKLDLDPAVMVDQMMHPADAHEIEEYGVFDTKLTVDEFYGLWLLAMEEADRDAYVSEAALSTVWLDYWIEEIPEEHVAYVENIWDAVHMPLEDFIARSGMCAEEFLRHYIIGREEVEHWQLDPSAMPHFARVMIARSLNMI